MKKHSSPEGQGNIPHRMNELIPQVTFFTQVVNRGILGHYVVTASLATEAFTFRALVRNCLQCEGFGLKVSSQIHIDPMLHPESTTGNHRGIGRGLAVEC
jgi:hypothetical protein